MFDFTGMTAEQLLARSEELRARSEAIAAEIRADGADVEALSAEADGNVAERQAISEELEARRAAAQQAAEQRADDFNGGTHSIEQKGNDNMEEKRFAIDSVEYRDAWTKMVTNRPLTEEERSALSSAGAVIPTLTIDAVWDRLIDEAELLGRVDVSQFPNYVRFPVATTVNAATRGAVGTTVSESSDVIGYVDLTPNEYLKLLTVGADIDHMAIPAVHDWIINNIVDSIRAKVNSDIIAGSGSNQIKGILASVNANATALTAAGLTKGDLLNVMGALGANYQKNAIFIMTAKLFYGEVLTLTTLNDFVVNDGFKFKIFGHDVILMDELKVSNKETILYGDPKAFKVNFFSPIEVKPFETATTTNKQFRGAAMVDGELLDTSAFVRFAKT